jgi:hypothetical protein
MLNALVVIVGFYYLIKFIFEEKRSKKHKAEIERWAKGVVNLQSKMTNYELEKKYSKPMKYSVLREEIGMQIIKKAYPSHDLRTGFLGEYERKYEADKSFGDKAVVDWRVEAIYAAVKMSEHGYVPSTWFITTGMPLGIHTCAGARIKESIAIAKKIQENLRANGSDYHVCFLRINAHGAPDPSEEKFSRCYVCLQEACSPPSQTTRVDEIHY